MPYIVCMLDYSKLKHAHFFLLGIILHYNVRMRNAFDLKAGLADLSHYFSVILTLLFDHINIQRIMKS